MILYHGTYIDIRSIDLDRCMPYKDFGKGFYLTDIEQQAQQLFLRLVKEMTKKQKITEYLKATDQMLWVGKMNTIRNADMEIVNKEIIYV